MNVSTPVVDTWYESDEFEEIFKVVVLDLDEKSIGVQFFSGEIEEFDVEFWRNLHHLEEIAQPEDVSGVYELHPEDQPEYSDLLPNSQISDLEELHLIH